MRVGALLSCRKPAQSSCASCFDESKPIQHRTSCALRRRQGMRLGALFSAVLDPSKPPLFGEGTDLSLVPQEAWHPSVAGVIRVIITMQARPGFPS